MLQNAYFLAKIGADTAENEQHFAEILPTDALWLAGRQAVREMQRMLVLAVLGVEEAPAPLVMVRFGLEREAGH